LDTYLIQIFLQKFIKFKNILLYLHTAEYNNYDDFSHYIFDYEKLRTNKFFVIYIYINVIIFFESTIKEYLLIVIIILYFLFITTHFSQIYIYVD